MNFATRAKMTNFKIDIISDPICPWVSLPQYTTPQSYPCSQI